MTLDTATESMFSRRTSLGNRRSLDALLAGDSLVSSHVAPQSVDVNDHPIGVVATRQTQAGTVESGVFLTPAAMPSVRPPSQFPHRVSRHASPKRAQTRDDDK